MAERFQRGLPPVTHLFVQLPERPDQESLGKGQRNEQQKILIQVQHGMVLGPLSLGHGKRLRSRPEVEGRSTLEETRSGKDGVSDS